ncbi:hypothetical protein NQ314_005368 [Rhamnusium bicolor]|uniref:Uncharacterized protein n=1 Tax=Rhamnusium bicolor TaxID=1586634 RepID=A0AAV8ZHA5_9CUCU|nr:hypothetical protein NQ314_005368 [Rhamnusium bicolor]
MTTGVTPYSLIFKHQIRTRLDLLAEKNDKENRNVSNYKGKRDEIFVEGDGVWCRDYRNPNKKVNEKVIWRRHMKEILRDRIGEEIKDDNKVFSELKLVVPELDISLPCSSSNINDKAFFDWIERLGKIFNSAKVQSEEGEKKGKEVIKDKTPSRKINDRLKRKSELR